VLAGGKIFVHLVGWIGDIQTLSDYPIWVRWLASPTSSIVVPVVALGLLWWSFEDAPRRTQAGFVVSKGPNVKAHYIAGTILVLAIIGIAITNWYRGNSQISYSGVAAPEKKDNPLPPQGGQQDKVVASIIILMSGHDGSCNSDWWLRDGNSKPILYPIHVLAFIRVINNQEHPLIIDSIAPYVKTTKGEWKRVIWMNTRTSSLYAYRRRNNKFTKITVPFFDQLIHERPIAERAYIRGWLFMTYPAGFTEKAKEIRIELLDASGNVHHVYPSVGDVEGTVQDAVLPIGNEVEMRGVPRKLYYGADCPKQ
jgi:hypothetical protein